MNNENLKKEIERLKIKISALEKDLDVLYNVDNSKIARAIHEIQEHLRKEGMYIINDIYAPTMVGMS